MKSACKLHVAGEGGEIQGWQGVVVRDMPLIKLIYAKYNSNKQYAHVRAKIRAAQKSQKASAPSAVSADDAAVECQNKWHVYHTPSGPQCVEQFGSCIYIQPAHTHKHSCLHWAMM